MARAKRDPEKPMFPESIGACVDKLYTLRAERLAAQKKVDDTQALETALRDHVITKFGKSDLEGAKGKIATCSVTKKTVAAVKDWEAFQKWIYKHRALDMLERRVSSTAYRARLDAHIPVPGVEPFVVVGLSLTKLGRKGS